MIVCVVSSGLDVSVVCVCVVRCDLILLAYVLTEDFLVSGVVARLLLLPVKSLYSFRHPSQSMLRYAMFDVEHHLLISMASTFGHISDDIYTIQVETRSEAAATNGGVTATAKEEGKSSPKQRDSLERRASPQTEEDKGREDRARTLSARSFDPLPEIPKFDTAEEGKGQRPKNSPSVARGGDIDDEDDEAGYAYARVGGAAVGGVETADSDKEDKSDSASGGHGSGLPPYGKVSHHVTKAKITETEEYAEVKEVFRGPATAAAKRARSSTDPIDPSQAGTDSMREKRALTHTHMMPLPAVPRPQESIDDSEMYDSIPDDMRNSQVPLPQQASAAANSKPRPKERLYESMDDMEDTYESVPDNLKPDSPPPLPLTPVSPNTSPSKAPLLSPSTSPPLPPSSPVPKTTAKEPEKKPLEKTLSAAQAEHEGDGKRRFSFFGRKKTASVSGIGSRKEREKHKDQKDHKGHKDHKDHKEHHHMPHQPLPDVPSQPPLMSPPLPPIPNQDYDDDTTYDTPQLDFMTDPSRLSPAPLSPSGVLDAKAKSQSLPSSARGAGAGVFHSRANVPLPRVPEDSGQGLVIRERVLESPLRGEEEEKPYDSVKVLTGGDKPYDTVQVLDEGENIDEPNYDTVHPEEIFKAVLEAENNEADPGYDRIKQLREEGKEEGEEEGAAASAQPTEGEGAGIRYGKVTRPLSPEDDKLGIVPEHDEEGYAVVPEDFKMRKRALSASKGVNNTQIKRESPEGGYNSINEVEEAATASTDEPMEPSEPYATVNIIPKKKDILTIEAELAERQRSTSPIPPPVPPAGDLGDMEEFSQPPIPVQSEGIHELLPADDERGSPSLKPPGSDEPPYAKVKSKDHPYAELNLGAVGEIAKLANPEDTNNTEAAYDEVGVDTTKSAAALKDAALGYDTVADQDTVEDEALGYHKVGSTVDQKTEQEQGTGYDTVVDTDRGRGENGASARSQLEQETPKLEPAEPQQLYDSLEPLKEDEEGKEEPAGNLYDSLETEQPQNGVNPEDVEEERYEEIDEDRRMQLIAKQKQSSQAKLS